MTTGIDDLDLEQMAAGDEFHRVEVPEPKKASISQATASELFNSVSGFEDQAVKAKFGMPTLRLNATDNAEFLRALIFVEKRRGGMSDQDAYDAAQTLGFGDMNAYFTEDDEITPDAPTTESGKGS